MSISDPNIRIASILRSINAASHPPSGRRHISGIWSSPSRSANVKDNFPAPLKESEIASYQAG